MRELYPAIDPHDHGHLPVGDGQEIYWEVSGNPHGKPVVFVHGGPGGGTSAKQRRFFNPAAYRIELVLRGIFLLRRSEIDWYYNGGAAGIFPDRWEDYLAPIPVAERGGNLVAAYHRILTGPDRPLAQQAAAAWTGWETSTSYLLPQPESAADDPRFSLAFATIENHYFTHGGFLRDGQLLDEVDTIADIPAVIVQGRYDVVCPMRSAWDLHCAWPSTELRIVDDAGHASFEPGTIDALVAATDGFANR